MKPLRPAAGRAGSHSAYVCALRHTCREQLRQLQLPGELAVNAGADGAGPAGAATHNAVQLVLNQVSERARGAGGAAIRG